jgi:lysozyme
MLSDIAKRKLLAHLYVYEGYREFPYDDMTGKTEFASIGKMTLGIGWNIQSAGCPREIAEFAAMYFIRKIDTDLSRRIAFYEMLDEPTKVALCDMAYNMGVGGVLSFKNMLECIRKDDRLNAAIAGLNSKWAHQVKRRAVIVMAMIETKEWVQK